MRKKWKTGSAISSTVCITYHTAKLSGHDSLLCMLYNWYDIPSGVTQNEWKTFMDHWSMNVVYKSFCILTYYAYSYFYEWRLSNGSATAVVTILAKDLESSLRVQVRSHRERAELRSCCHLCGWRHLTAQWRTQDFVKGAVTEFVTHEHGWGPACRQRGGGGHFLFKKVDYSLDTAMRLNMRFWSLNWLVLCEIEENRGIRTKICCFRLN